MIGIIILSILALAAICGSVLLIIDGEYIWGILLAVVGVAFATIDAGVIYAEIYKDEIEKANAEKKAAGIAKVLAANSN